jgi:hypothetical protein
MPAGLGALTQMGPTPRGKSPSNMGQVMAMARKMSDMQLADVLQGKSLAVPQFAAMTEAMGRKSLRNAMQGAEAQMQAKQPSVKDKLLAEEAAQQLPEASGIGQIPAPNMESMGMAGGGIIAFDDGGEVPRFNGALDPSLIKSALELDPNQEIDPKNTFLMRRIKEVEDAKERAKKDKPFFSRATEPTMYPNPNPRSTQNKPLTGNSPIPGEYIPPPDPSLLQALPPRNLVDAGAAATRSNVPPPAGDASPRPSAGGGGGSPRVNPNLPDELKFDTTEFDKKYRDLLGPDPTFTKRDNPFYNMKYEGDDPRKVREEGIGFGLMKAGQALLKNPTFAGGLGDAIGAFGDQGWLTAKELKAAKKDERDYNFNMAKASEAFEQGQEDKALQFATLAQNKQKSVLEMGLNAFKAQTDLFTAKNQAKYQQGSLEVQKMQANKPDSGIAMLDRILKDNKNMSVLDAVKAMYGARTGEKQGTLSRDTAARLWENMSKAEKKGYGDFENYYQTQNNQLLSGTIPEGAVIRPS